MDNSLTNSQPIPEKVSLDVSPKKERLPLKTLDAFIVSKGGTSKRSLVDPGPDKPAKSARRKSAPGEEKAVKASQTSQSSINRPEHEGVCSEVTSSCDSDKLVLPVQPKVVGPLDSYLHTIPQPDPIGVSSTIDEGLKQQQQETVVIESDDSDKDDDSLMQDESFTSNSTVGETRPSRPSSPERETTANAETDTRKKNSKNAGALTTEQREQKRVLREEKKKQRAAEKHEKQRRLQEQKEKREQDKQAKEAERKQKNEEKERERQEKLQEKEEKRKRKAEAEQKQLEEKRRKEDEKQKAEEEKLRRQQAQKNLMLNFLKKAGKQEQSPGKRELVPSGTAEPSGSTHVRFKPFQLKEGMQLAPMARVSATTERLHHLCALLQAQDCNHLYLSEVKDSGFTAGRSRRTIQHVNQNEEVHVVEVDQTGAHMCKKKRYMKVKLLQFAENTRPAYYGTWRKTSSAVKPRRPFACDKELLNYEVDSDEEWDEEEPGESTSVKDEDEEDDEGNEDNEEMDPELKSEGFLVEHGYLSDGEGAEDDEEEDECSLQQRKEKQRLLNRLDWEQKKRRQRNTRDTLRAVVVGCFYDDGSKESSLRLAGELDALRQYQAVLYASTPIATRLGNPELLGSEGLDRDDEAATPSSSATPATGDKSGSAASRWNTGGSSGRRGRERQLIPEEAMPDLIRLVHGNVLGLQHIIKEFVCYWKRHDIVDPSATCTEADATVSTAGEVGRTSIEPVNEAEMLRSSPIVTAGGTAAFEPDTPQLVPPLHVDDIEEPAAAGAVTSSPAVAADEPVAAVASMPVSTGERTPTAVASAGTISKRQLGLKIRAMAVYEKRPDYKRICWYVNEDVISRYFGGPGQQSKSELSVPTTWKYVTRVQHQRGCGRPPKKPNAVDTSGELSFASCATPKSSAPSIQSGETASTEAGSTPRRASPAIVGSSAATAAAAAVSNSKAAKACQPRRIVPTPVTAEAGSGSNGRASDSVKSSGGCVDVLSAQPNGQTATPQPPNTLTSVEFGSARVAGDQPKPRRVTLTTLYTPPVFSSSPFPPPPVQPSALLTPSRPVADADPTLTASSVHVKRSAEVMDHASEPAHNVPASVSHTNMSATADAVALSSDAPAATGAGRPDAKCQRAAGTDGAAEATSMQLNSRALFVEEPIVRNSPAAASTTPMGKGHDSPMGDSSSSCHPEVSGLTADVVPPGSNLDALSVGARPNSPRETAKTAKDQTFSHEPAAPPAAYSNASSSRTCSSTDGSVADAAVNLSGAACNLSAAGNGLVADVTKSGADSSTALCAASAQSLRSSAAASAMPAAPSATSFLMRPASEAIADNGDDSNL